MNRYLLNYLRRGGFSSPMQKIITRFLSTSTKYRPNYSKTVKPKSTPKPHKKVEAFPKDLFTNETLRNAHAVKLKTDTPTPKPAETTKTQTGRVLTRDFIHDSLYNPQYGYFSKRAIIFSFPEDMDFQKMKNLDEFMETVQSYYNQYDDFEGEEALQVWHTPTELFKVCLSR